MIKREFIVQRQGKDFVLYAGLLDLAHSQGLKAIRTHLLQAPSDANGQVAIVHAEVETEKGFFSGLGDAAPGNVNQAMVAHLIRLAETRAKARALRDAVNVGVAAVEELGPDVADEEPAMPIPAPPPSGRPKPAAPPAASPASLAATPAQIRAIYAIARDQYGYSEQETNARCQDLYGVAVDALTKRQASDFITTLQGGKHDEPPF